MSQVLLVEREPRKRKRLRKSLEAGGLSVVEACDMETVRHTDIAGFSAVFANAELCSGTGTDLIASVGPVPVVLLAGDASIPHAVACMRRGAADYLPAPHDADALLSALRRIEGASDKDACPVDGPRPMIGKSPAMAELIGRIAKVAPTESTVLVQGESGTGKELVAHTLHHASGRRHQPMVTLKCATIPGAMIESELFGHPSVNAAAVNAASVNAASANAKDENGSRLGLLESADHGTLFLDEVGELPAEAQARLLRVLEDGEIGPAGSGVSRRVDVRIIAATRLDLRSLTESGRFREDLFYRLNVITLELPPLRERGDDAVEVAHSILDRLGRQFDKQGIEFAAEALESIKRYHWPGNVRELENAVERAVILCDDQSISTELLAIEPDSPTRPPMATDNKINGSDTLEDYFINFVLEHQDELTETEMASRLGISRKSLWERRQRLKIPRRGARNRGPRRSA